MTTQMIVRIDPDLKAKVYNFAKVEGQSVSEVVRELLEEYVKTRDMESYIYNLWDRIEVKSCLVGLVPRMLSALFVMRGLNIDKGFG